MDKNFVERICRKYINRFYPDIQIVTLQILDLYSQDFETKTWKENGEASAFIVVNNPRRFSGLNELKNQLEGITGCEVYITL